MSFSKQDLINAGIPQDVAIETLYQEILHGGLSSLPRKTMIRTLRVKYPSVKTLGDLFSSSTPDTKPFSELKAGIIAMAPTVCAVHKASGTVITIPSAPFSSLEEGLRLFLPAYLAAKRKRASTHKTSVEAYCRTLEMLFDENSSDPSRDKVARLLKVTRQNIDEKVKQAHREFRGMFFSGKTPGHIAPDPGLVQMVRDFGQGFTVPASDTEMIRQSQVKSPRMLELLALILGYTVLDSGMVIPAGRKSPALGTASGHILDRNKLAMKRILKKEGIPVSFSDFRILMQHEFADAQLRHTLEQYARNGKEYEVFKDSAGVERITVRWEHLQNFSAEIIRILYDNDAWGPAHAMGPDAIRKEWERRAKLSGKKFQFHPHYTHWRLCSVNGFVMLRRSRQDYYPEGQKYVSDLVYANPKWTIKDFDKVVAQAKADGYDVLYSERSLRTYFTNVVKDTVVEDALVAAVGVLDYTAGKTLPFPDLLADLNAKGHPVTGGTLRKWIMRNGATFSYGPMPGSRTCAVKLISKKAPLVTPLSAPSTPAPAAKRASAAAKPAAKPASQPAAASTQPDWNAISKAFLAMVPEAAQFPSLLSHFGKVYDIMKGGGTSFKYNSVFLGWLPGLPAYGGMTSWGKDGFRNGVLKTVEPYLDNFYQMKKNSDLRTDILLSPAYNVQNIGLGTKVSFLSSLGLLPDRKGLYPGGTPELAVSKATKDVVTARNLIMAHSASTVSLDEKEMTKQVHDALLLFLYLASKL